MKWRLAVYDGVFKVDRVAFSQCQAAHDAINLSVAFYFLTLQSPPISLNFVQVLDWDLDPVLTICHFHLSIIADRGYFALNKTFIYDLTDTRVLNGFILNTVEKEGSDGAELRQLTSFLRVLVTPKLALKWCNPVLLPQLRVVACIVMQMKQGSEMIVILRDLVVQLTLCHVLSRLYLVGNDLVRQSLAHATLVKVAKH